MRHIYLKHRGLLANALLCCVSVSISVGTLEALLHLYRGAPLSANYYEPSESLGYVLKPSTKYFQSDGSRVYRITIDSEGHRVVAGAPASAAHTVAVIGDSNVFGWGLADEETIPSQLQTVLGLDWKVVNLGVPGYGPATYVKVAAGRTDTVLVILQTDANDLEEAQFVRSPMKSYCGYLAVNSSMFTDVPCIVWRSFIVNELMYIRSWRNKSKVPLQYTAAGLTAARLLRARIDSLYRSFLAKYRGRVLFATVPWDATIEPRRLRNYQPLLNEAHRFVELPDNTQLANIEKRFRAAIDRDALFLPGDEHLSARGVRLTAEELARDIRNSSSGKWSCPLPGYGDRPPDGVCTMCSRACLFP